MLDAGRDPFSKRSRFFLGNTGQDVGHEIRDLAAFTDAMYRYPKALQFLPTAHPLQDPPPQPVEAKAITYLAR